MSRTSNDSLVLLGLCGRLAKQEDYSTNEFFFGCHFMVTQIHIRSCDIAYRATHTNKDLLNYFLQTSDEDPRLRVADVILRENDEVPDDYQPQSQDEQGVLELLAPEYPERDHADA